MKLSDMAERQILKAEAEGQFRNLRGAGKPLNMDNDAGSSEAVGFRIMAEAGALPREIELRKAVAAQTERLKAALSDEDRRRETKALADLQLRLDIEAEARRRFQGR